MEKNIFDIKELGFIPPKYGGVSVSIARLIEKLSEDGFVVGGFYTEENTNPQIHNSNLFELNLNLSTKHIISELPRCLKVLRPYKVLHSHYSLEHMIYLWCFLHFLNKKIIVTVHNSMVQSSYHNCDFINRFFLKLVAKHPNVTWIAVSEQAKEEMQKLPVNFNQPIHVVPAYIPDEKEVKGLLCAPLLQYIEKHEQIIVFYGHSFMLHEGKDVYGFRDALELYAEVLASGRQSVGFILCLTENREMDKIEELRRMANDLGIEKKMFWQLEPLENMNPLWNRTDVYIRPTCTDGDSVAVREAIDLGCQVVASDVCPRPPRTILYSYGDKKDFLSKVNLALDNGHTEAKPNYDNYIKLKKIYQELLEQ